MNILTPKQKIVCKLFGSSSPSEGRCRQFGASRRVRTSGLRPEEFAEVSLCISMSLKIRAILSALMKIAVSNSKELTGNMFVDIPILGTAECRHGAFVCG